MRLGVNPYPTGTDEHYLWETLELAHGGLGWTSPNPLVGCVLVRNGEVIGQGYHQQDGGKHAEVNALEDAGDAQGATCYVNLEPCSHVARQPSCCHELARAGVAKVVYGSEDTDQRTAGRAQTILPELGVAVRAGVLQNECDRFLDFYLAGRRLQRAYLHLKLAVSLDAKVACASGHSRWLSGPESLGFAHYLRQKYDAVLVGYRTVLVDNPRLTTRKAELKAFNPLATSAPERNPVRIILDPSFKCLNQSSLHIFNTAGPFRNQIPRLVFVGLSHYAPKPQVNSSHLEIIALDRSNNGEMSFAELAKKLWKLNIRSVLVEGGGELARRLLKQQLADKVSLVYTPTLIGSEGIDFTPALKCTTLADCPRLADAQPMVLGCDAVLSGYPVRDEALNGASVVQ